MIAKTWDKTTDNNINILHPKVIGYASDFINYCDREKNVKLRVYSSYRSIKEQNDLYAQGRTIDGKIVTNAKGGYSYHNYGLAIDLVEIKDGVALWKNERWLEIGSWGRSFGFEWGGDFKKIKDNPHFQMSFGYTVQKLLRLHTENQYNGKYLIL